MALNKKLIKSSSTLRKTEYPMKKIDVLKKEKRGSLDGTIIMSLIYVQVSMTLSIFQKGVVIHQMLHTVQFSNLTETFKF